MGPTEVLSKERTPYWDCSALRTAEADIATLQAQIARKIVRAPFAGTLGMRTVNLGQYLSAGDALVSGLGATGWVMAGFSVVGVLMAVLMGRHREPVGTLQDAAAAAAAHTYTLPTSATPTAEATAIFVGERRD